MLERIVIVKTFILSKVWFLANFSFIDKDMVKTLNGYYLFQIHTICFKFIWNSSQETIRRDSLILTYERGGLNMLHIESKLKTINIRNFLYIIKNINRSFFCLSIYWLKFCLRDYLTNFNIVPSGRDVDRPVSYRKMILDINDLKEFNKNFIKDKFLNKSKNIYMTFRKKFENQPKCELIRINSNIVWKDVYIKILNKQLNAELRIFNYKILIGRY